MQKRKGYWRNSNSPILARALTNNFMKEQGIITLTKRYLSFKYIFSGLIPNATYVMWEIT